MVRHAHPVEAVEEASHAPPLGNTLSGVEELLKQEGIKVLQEARHY